MATKLTALQTLAESPCESIAAYVDGWLGWLDAHVTVLDAQTADVEAVMRHDESRDGRGTAYSPQRGVGVVTATSVRASDRERVRDGHDARKAEDRSSWRNVTAENPYGDDWRLRDDAPLGEGLSPADRCSAVVTTHVPLWAARLPHSERHHFATSGRVTSQPVTRAELVGNRRQTARTSIDAAIVRHQRQRDAARGDARYAHDFTAQ